MLFALTFLPKLIHAAARIACDSRLVVFALKYMDCRCCICRHAVRSYTDGDRLCSCHFEDGNKYKWPSIFCYSKL